MRPNWDENKTETKSTVFTLVVIQIEFNRIPGRIGKITILVKLFMIANQKKTENA